MLCDRFSDATLAYQGYGRGLDLEMIQALDRIVTGGMRPDLTILLRHRCRPGFPAPAGRNSSQGLEAEARFENEELAFHERVRQGYLALAGQEPDRFRIVDACAGDPRCIQNKRADSMVEELAAGTGLGA